MLNTQHNARFSAGLRGSMVQPDDADRDRARSVFHAMIDRHPRLIVYAADPVDVARTVRFAG